MWNIDWKVILHDTFIFVIYMSNSLTKNAYILFQWMWSAVQKHGMIFLALSFPDEWRIQLGFRHTKSFTGCLLLRLCRHAVSWWLFCRETGCQICFWIVGIHSESYIVGDPAHCKNKRDFVLCVEGTNGTSRGM